MQVKSSVGVASLAAPWRVLLLLVATVLLSLTVVARGLEPETVGFGTHEQLGLRPCLMRQLLGQRCPSCGMTTAWAHVARGELRHAIRANVGGTILAVAALAFVPWAVASAFRGAWWYVSPREPVVLATISVLILIILFDWFWRIWPAPWLEL